MDYILLAAFLLLHTVDGREVAINSDQVTNVVNGKDGEGNKLLVDKVHCVISFNNGRFISVLEDCADVLRMIEGGQP
jgi:hypothetical protein